MLNYANLNDMEFEALCRDVMEQKLGVSLRRFGPGKDGGVDLTDDVAQKEIIVQVKHYRKSDTSALIRSLKGERSKVDKLQPKKYYICCSTELSHSRINELYQYFEPYMDSDRHIVTLIEIDEFLHQEANRDILKRHFKLWLDDTGILTELYNDDIFVDCEALLSDVEELQKLFVRTSAFDRALSVLESNHPLCIIGDPGVGKSITSKMLVLHYAALGYRVRYTTDVTDLKALKRALRDDSAAKEVILLDDCFGQAYFEMKSSQSSELVALIKYIKLHPNKILILNSRVTIFQEARERNRDLVHSLERKEFQVHFLNMNELSGEEKAKILYNHLAFNGVPAAFFDEIRMFQRYREIISHPNYSPRIIEFVCTPSRHQKIPANQFYVYIRKQLDSPQEMWADEYDNRLQPADRILLQTIYSMTTNTVSADLVRRCFDRRIATIPSIDNTLDQYSRSLKRLNEGFVKIIDNRGVSELSMHNPSVNDFLNSRLREGTLEYQALIASICNDKQLLRLIPEKNRLSYAVRLLQTGAIDQFIFADSHQRSRFIARCVLSAELFLNQYRVDLYDFLSLWNDQFQWFFIHGDEWNQIVKALQNPAMWDFYQLREFFSHSDHFLTFLKWLNLDEAIKIIITADIFYPKGEDTEFIRQVEMFLDEAILAFCKVDADKYEDFLDYSVAIERSTKTMFANEYGDDSDAYTIQEDKEGQLDISEMVSILEEEIKYKVLDDLGDILYRLPKRFLRYFYENNYSDCVFVSGTDALAENYFSEITFHDYSCDNGDTTGYSSIDAIFER